MKKLFPLSTLLFMLIAASAPFADAQDAIGFESATSAEAVTYSSAGATALEKTFHRTFDDVISETADETAVFSLQDDDILSWEESGRGKYLYFRLTDAKNAELAKLTSENIGKPLRLNINDNFILLPEITEGLQQSGGFVLMAEESRRLELMHSMLDWAKKAQNSTVLNISPAVVEVPEIPKPAPAKAQTPPVGSGPADSVP